MTERKMLSELNLTNRFLFAQTMEYTQAYEALVSILLEEDVRFPAKTQTEKELRISPELRAARLDVISMDEYEKMYYTEMQGTNTGNLIKRSRFYQAQIDVSLLEPGERNFNKINSTCMILVAPFDIFGKGLYRYTFEGVCRECPELKLEDGALRIFINTQGTNEGDFSEEFLELVRYIENTTDEMAEKLTCERVKVIHECVTKVKLSEKMGVKYMQWWEELAEARDEGIEQGIERGIERGIEQGIERGREQMLVQKILSKLKKGLEPACIADALEEDEKWVRNICDIAAEFAPEYEFDLVYEKIKRI